MPNTRYHLVELHRPEEGWKDLESFAARARAAAEQVNSETTPVRFLRSIFVPDNATCFHLFEGTTAAARRVAVLAQLPVERVAEPIRIEAAAADGDVR
jgi:hypothetical protein